MLCNDTSVNSVTWTRFQRWVGGCLVILTTSLPMRATAEQVDTAATASIPPFAVSKKTETITVKCHRGDETRTIRVEWFEPNASGKHPAIVLLHGVDGAEGENGQTYRNQAVCYVRKGYVVLLPHYFDWTGGERLRLEDIKERFRCYYNLRCLQKQGDKRALKEQFDIWMDGVRQIVVQTGAAGERGSPPYRVGRCLARRLPGAGGGVSG